MDCWFWKSSHEPSVACERFAVPLGSSTRGLSLDFDSVRHLYHRVRGAKELFIRERGKQRWFSFVSISTIRPWNAF